MAPVPGVYVVFPSDFVTNSETLSRSVSLSDPLAAFPLVASVAVAVLTSGFVVMPAANATGTLNTSEFPAPASTRAASAPKLVCPVIPLTVPQAEVPVALQITLPDSFAPAGSESATVTFKASERPAFATVTV